jgi:hypothetical protein
MTNSKPSYEVALYLKGDNLYPEELTLHLGVEPTRAHKKGEAWLTSTGKKVVEQTGLWAISLRDSGDVSTGIRQLVAKFSGRENSLLDLSNIEEAYFDVFVAREADEDGGGTSEFDIDATTAAALGKLALPIRLTVVVVPK